MLELYYFENSICAERPLMVLAEKGVTDWVPHHIHLFRGEQFDPAYLKLNPKAQVPTLVHDGAIIRESTLICDYLDDLYPHPPLKPGSPVELAHMREWIKEADEGGFEGVASLSFVAVFRAKLLAMPEDERNAYWAGQTVLERTQRQQSCVFDGFDSPYALRAIAIWERIFAKIDKTIAAGGPVADGPAVHPGRSGSRHLHRPARRADPAGALDRRSAPCPGLVAGRQQPAQLCRGPDRAVRRGGRKHGQGRREGGGGIQEKARRIRCALRSGLRPFSGKQG